MEKQNYRNHIRYYAPHHFIYYPIVIAGIAVGIYGACHYPEQRFLWLMITGLFFLFIYLGLMVRQHYALGNQDRIVRLEMRLRYYILTNHSFNEAEELLTFDQLKALRFAGDAELLSLIDRAIKEHLSAKDIKKAIKNWTADEMRL